MHGERDLRALTEMVRQQEVGDAVLDPVLVPAVPAHHLALLDLRLEEQRVEIAQGLVALLRLFVRGRGGICEFWLCGGDVGEAELVVPLG